MLKRKNTSGDPGPTKRPRVDSGEGRSLAQNRVHQSVTAPRTNGQPEPQRRGKGKRANTEANATRPPKNKTAANSSERREIIHKLAPPRPFLTVPSSVSASGPKSVHKEGKNLICITRHTPLAAYLNRCKKLLVDDGYQILHLHAMGAAIPHLLTLSVSLPPILPFTRNEIELEVRTGTIEVMDEVVPTDEDEDIRLRTRDKGGVNVVIKIRDGKECISAVAKNHQPPKRARDKPEILIIREQDQDDEMDENRDQVGTDD